MHRPKKQDILEKTLEKTKIIELTEEEKEAATIAPDEKELKEDKSKFNPDDELLTVVISNLETAGRKIPIGCGPTNNPFKATYEHGETYTIPRWVVRHIESRCTPVYIYTSDGSGKKYKKLSHYKNRFSCKQVF